MSWTDKDKGIQFGSVLSGDRYKIDDLDTGSAYDVIAFDGYLQPEEDRKFMSRSKFNNKNNDDNNNNNNNNNNNRKQSSNSSNNNASNNNNKYDSNNSNKNINKYYLHHYHQ